MGGRRRGGRAVVVAAAMVAIDVAIFDSVLPPYPQLFFRVRPRSMVQDHLYLAQMQSRARGELCNCCLGVSKRGGVD